MQLIQIGEVKQKTVLELVQEMAARQLTEIEQLKIAAQNRSRSRHSGQFRKATELIGGRLRAVSGLPLRNSGKNDSRYTLIPGFLSLLPSWSKI